MQFNLKFIIGLVVIITIASGFIYWQYSSASKSDSIEQISDSVTVSKYFPDFFNAPTSIFPDSKDSNIVWFSGRGGVVKYNLAERKIEEIITGINGIDTIPTSIVVVDDNLFVSDQAGFRKINLTTKESKVYRMEDGLIDGSNIHLFADNFDEETIWVGTFRGLSKFNIKNETFTNFKEEIDINGSSWTINEKVKVGKDYVWVIVGASAYSEGGIARYDKRSGRWKTWGPEAFGVTGRVDLFKFDIDEDRAFVEGPFNNIFEYNTTTDLWKLIIVGERSISNRKLTYSKNRIYFYENTDKFVIKFMDLSDYSVHSLGETEFTNIYNDTQHERLILSNTSKNENISILDLRTNKQEIITLNIKEEYKIVNVIDVHENLIFLKSDKDFYIYNRDKDNLIRVDDLELSSYTLNEQQTIKVINEKLIIVDMPIGEIGPAPNSSIFILSLDNFKVETKAEIEGHFDRVIFGDSLSEIYFEKKYKNSLVTYRFSDDVIQNSKLILDDLEVVNIYTTDSIGEEYNKFISITNDNGLVVKAERSVNGNTISVEFIEKDKSAVTKVFSLGERYYNAFDWQPRAVVTNFAFSKTNPKTLWVGTNRGLIWYNMEDDKSGLFTTKNGLVSNFVEKLFVDNDIIIEHPIGVYVYSYKVPKSIFNKIFSIFQSTDTTETINPQSFNKIFSDSESVDEITKDWELYTDAPFGKNFLGYSVPGWLLEVKLPSFFEAGRGRGVFLILEEGTKEPTGVELQFGVDLVGGDLEKEAKRVIIEYQNMSLGSTAQVRYFDEILKVDDINIKNGCVGPQIFTEGINNSLGVISYQTFCIMGDNIGGAIMIFEMKADSKDKQALENLKPLYDIIISTFQLNKQ